MIIKIAGQIADTVGSISLTTDSEANGEEMSFSSLARYDVGSHVSVIDEGKVQFLGVIVSVDETPLPPYSYRAIDLSWNLKSDMVIQFKNVRIDDAIHRLCKRIGVTCSTQYVTNMLSRKISGIYKDTAVNIINQLLEKATSVSGIEFYFEVRGEKLYIYECFSLKLRPSGLFSDQGTITYSIEDVKNEIYVVDGNGTELAWAWSDSSIAKLGTLRQNVEVEEKTEIPTAEKTALSTLHETNRMKATTSVELLARSDVWEIRKNRSIYIDAGKIRGWYRILSATHTVEDDMHRFTLEIEWYGKVS